MAKYLSIWLSSKKVLPFEWMLASQASQYHLPSIKKLSFLNRTYPGFRHYEEADDQVEECTAAVRKEHAPDSDTDI